MYTYLTMVRKMQPYLTSNLNNLDTYSNLCSACSLLFSLLYSKENSVSGREADFAQPSVFVLIVIMNCAYLLYWFISVLRTLYFKVTDFVKR